MLKLLLTLALSIAAVPCLAQDDEENVLIVRDSTGHLRALPFDNPAVPSFEREPVGIEKPRPKPAELHGQLSAFVFTGFGKHSIGSGFGEQLALSLSKEITPRLLLEVGGYYHHLYYRGNNFGSVGLNADLVYRINERTEAIVFAQKVIARQQMPLPLYFVSGQTDKIGAALRYHFSPSFSVEVSAWRESVPADYRYW